MSQQGLSKARNKFDHTPFLRIFQGVCDAFYSREFLDNSARCDGNLLTTPELKNKGRFYVTLQTVKPLC